MPYGRRYDWPGALHHVMSRGINGMRILGDTRHKLNFVEVMDRYLPEAGMKVHAWSLMGNHFHLLTETGEVPLSTVMHRLLTRWATRFNSVEDRKGRVFQGRYRSIPVADEEYYLTLVAYINANPLRGGIVRDDRELEKYPFSGHGYACGNRTARVWEQLARDYPPDSYRRAFLKMKKLDTESPSCPSVEQTTVSGKGIETAEANDSSNENKAVFYGNSAYAAGVLKNETDRRLQPVRNRNTQHSRAEEVKNRICRIHRVSLEQLRGPSRRREVVIARRAFITELVVTCGWSFSDVARYLNKTRQAVSAAFRVGLDS